MYRKPCSPLSDFKLQLSFQKLATVSDWSGLLATSDCPITLGEIPRKSDEFPKKKKKQNPDYA